MRVVLVHKETDGSLLLSRVKRDPTGRVVFGLVENGGWYLRLVNGMWGAYSEADAPEEEHVSNWPDSPGLYREVEVPFPLLGDYNEVIEWAVTQPSDPAAKAYPLFTGKPAKEVPLVLYKAEVDPSKALGLTADSKLVFGTVLTLVLQEGHDALADEVLNGWEGDCLSRIILPEGGLEVGKLYQPIVVNEKRDPETNAVDDWDVKLVEWVAP